MALTPQQELELLELEEQEYLESQGQEAIESPVNQSQLKPAGLAEKASRALTSPSVSLPLSPMSAVSGTRKVFRAGMATPTPFEDTLPTVGGIAGGVVGGMATLPSGAGVPFGATAGAGIGGQLGETARQYVRAFRGKETPITPVEALSKTAVSGGVQAAGQLAGAGVVKAIQALGTAFPKIAFNKVIGVKGKELAQEALGDEAETIGIKAAEEVGNFGKSSGAILQKVKTELPKIGKQINEKIAEAYAKTKKTFDVGEFFDDATRELKQKLEINPDNDTAISALEELRNKYLNRYSDGNELTLVKMNDLKRALYDDISDSSWWKAYEKNPDKVKATLALARHARRLVSESVDGISDLNAQYGLYSTMKPFLAQVEGRKNAGFFAAFLEPVYEKGLTATGVAARAVGRAAGPVTPFIPGGVQSAVGAIRE